MLSSVVFARIQFDIAELLDEANILLNSIPPILIFAIAKNYMILYYRQAEGSLLFLE